mgnify:FL=1
MGVYLHYESDTDLDRRSFEDAGKQWMVSVKRTGHCVKIPFLLGIDPSPFLEVLGCDPKRISKLEYDIPVRARYNETIPTPDVERLLEYCVESLRAIAEAVDLERVRALSDEVPDCEHSRDYLDHFEYDAWRAFGRLRSICTMCRNALNAEIGLRTA